MTAMTHRAMYWRMVVRSLTRRRSRVAIAILAVAIGATTLFALAAIALDIPRQMGREVRSYGANLLVLPAEGHDALDRQVLPAIAALLPTADVVGVAPYRYETLRIHDQPFLASATDLAGAQGVSPYWYVDGAWPDQPGQILVGRDVAAWIDLAPGDTVALTGQDSAGADAHSTFTIAGVLSTGGSEDGLIVLSLDDLGALLGDGGRIDVIEYSVATTGSGVDDLADRISQTVAGASAGPVKRLTQSDTHVLDMLRSLLVLVAVIVLALTMIGVSTTMVAVVAERRMEIGLRKALGADQKSIVSEFVVESMVFGALGGLLGVGVGFALAQTISTQVFHRGLAFPPWLALATVAASVAVTRMACVIPVRQAADIDPAIVLKGE